MFRVQAGLRTRQKFRRLPNESSTKQFVFAAGLFLPGVNQQLDLQTAFIEPGGRLTRSEGSQQQPLTQVIYVLILGAAMAGAALIAIFKQKCFFKSHASALVGSIFLAAFVFLRAAVFSHVDNDVGIGLGGRQWLDRLELAEMLCFIVVSIRAGKISTQKNNEPPVPIATFLDKPVPNIFLRARLDFARAGRNVINQDRR